MTTFLFPMQTKAQSADFSEFTRSFFSQPKSYSIKNYGCVALGIDGLTECNIGEASFTVTSTGYSYKYKDGSGSSIRITSPLKNVTVQTLHDDVAMQMYITENGNAVRAIKYKDGHCVVYEYSLNIPSMKYYLHSWFTLRE